MTVSDDQRLPARINVNTASREVLITLPEMTQDLADAIIARRSGAAGPFRSLGELLTTKTLDEKQFRQLVDRLTVRSSVFSVESTGTAAWGVRCRILAVIDRSSSPMRVVFWYQTGGGS
jgi:hypothetical protein